MAKVLHRGHSEDGLMRGEGEFEILQTPEDLQEQLINIEIAGRICYRSNRYSITPETADRFIHMIMKRGHESVIEHSCLTVIFSNVSRGFTHEMVRHRLVSYSQESTRYVDYAGGKLDLEEAELTFIMPPHQEFWYSDTQKHGLACPSDVRGVINQVEETYKLLRASGWPPQDARQFLPIGIATKIAVTANLREWRHIFAMRTQEAAHWEIRYMMVDLLIRLKEIIPVIFDDFYPGGSDRNGYGYYNQVEKERM